MLDLTPVHVYQHKVWIQGISPMIWRRLLVRSDSTLTDLHATLQIAIGWSETHLNRFQIHGKDYSVYHSSGIVSPTILNSQCHLLVSSVLIRVDLE